MPQTPERKRTYMGEYMRRRRQLERLVLLKLPDRTLSVYRDVLSEQAKRTNAKLARSVRSRNRMWWLRWLRRLPWWETRTAEEERCARTAYSRELSGCIAPYGRESRPRLFQKYVTRAGQA